MSRYLSAYKTAACSGHVIKPVQDALISAYIKGDVSLDADSGCYLVTGLYSTSAIAAFNHPITMEYESKTLTFVDVRSSVRLEPHTTNFKVVAMNEYKFQTQRAHLDGLWNTEMPSILRDVSRLPLAAYAILVGEYVSRRLALDPRDGQVVIVLAAAFYLNLFNDEGNDRRSDTIHMSGIIANALSMRQPVVLDIIAPKDQEPGRNTHVMNSLEDFCKTCQEVSKSVRLRDLNPVTLMGLVGSAWYGDNGRELMAVALEHPPTWLALLDRALNDRGYLNSGLGRFLDRGIFKKLGANYPEQIKVLLQRQL